MNYGYGWNMDTGELKDPLDDISPLFDVRWQDIQNKVEQLYPSLGKVGECANYCLSDIRLTNAAIDRMVIGNHFSIKKVIFNDPATVIMWRDGSKTVVKCQPGDVYDPEKGFVMAYLKKLLGNDNTFNKEIAKWVKED